jgi:hypothetical protein
MVSPLTEAREHVAQLLSGLPVTVHPEPPEAPSGACIILAAGEPWAVNEPVAGRVSVQVAVTVAVPIAGGRGMLARLEDLVWLVLQTPGVQPDPGLPTVAAMGRQQLGTGDYYTATIINPVHVICD